MAKYALSFRRSAEKDLRKLDATVQRQVLRAIDGPASEPRPAGVRKLVDSDDVYRIRVGEYRVIDDVVLIVAIENVRHRREAYR